MGGAFPPSLCPFGGFSIARLRCLSIAAGVAVAEVTADAVHDVADDAVSVAAIPVPVVTFGVVVLRRRGRARNDENRGRDRLDGRGWGRGSLGLVVAQNRGVAHGDLLRLSDGLLRLLLGLGVALGRRRRGRARGGRSIAGAAARAAAGVVAADGAPHQFGRTALRSGRAAGGGLA